MTTRVAPARWLLALLTIAGCGQPPADVGDKADDPGADVGELEPSGRPIPKRRRSFVAVDCPEAEGAIAVAFFDADSTLRVSKSGSVSANAVDDVNILPFAAQHLARVANEGFLVAIVSNQGGVADGILPFRVAEGALAFTVAQLDRLGGHVHYFDMAEKRDEFRKPEIGMATKLDSLLLERCGNGIDFERSFMVGDSGFKKGVDGPHPDGRPADDFSNSDRLFAENLEIPFHEPTDFFGWRTDEVFNIENQGQLDKHLAAIEARAAALREQGGDAQESEALEREVAPNRAINGL
jgi:DNA 3'-phosphatase